MSIILVCVSHIPAFPKLQGPAFSEIAPLQSCHQARGAPWDSARASSQARWEDSLVYGHMNHLCTYIYICKYIYIIFVCHVSEYTCHLVKKIQVMSYMNQSIRGYMV